MTAHYPRDPSAATIAAAAARLIGTPEQLAAQLAALLGEGPPKPPKAGPDAAADHRHAVQRYADEVAALRHRLATDFAEGSGLQQTTAPMSRKELARRATPGGKWHRAAREWPGAFRSAAFYRGPDRRAAAMTVHALPEETDREAIAAWAAGHDLAASFPNYPSWERPGVAFLAVLEPAEPVAPCATAAPVPAPAEPPAAMADRDEQATAASPAPRGPAPVPAEPVDDVHPDPAPPTAPDLPDMRPVAPVDLDGAVPRDLSGEIGPDFDIVAPAELLIDESYQRGLGPKSIDLIRRIVRTWSWAKFKPPVCVRVDGRYHVLDGQHTAIAAASHGGIGAIPIVVIAGELEVTDRAAAFVSHATNRLQATALQIHRAALVAGDEEAVTLEAVCRRAGVELLPFAPSDGRYVPRQTVAVVGLRKLIARRGPDKASEILGALAAADLTPIAGDHIRLGEVLLCDEAYAGDFDADRLTAAMRGLTAKTHAEARELAIAQRLPAWRALAAVLARNSRGPAARRRAGA